MTVLQTKRKYDLNKDDSREIIKKMIMNLNEKSFELDF